ncbi:MAG: hypothetical protein ACE5HD_08830 [Acidobacteriota bacterium]
MRRLLIGVLLSSASLAEPAAWNAQGHRLITLLALDALTGDAPAWLREPAVQERVAFQSGELDRWRGWPALALRHLNEPDHFLDIDRLGAYGLTLETMPRLRREFLRVMVLAGRSHPERMRPYSPRKDPARTHQWPGFLAHAVSEQYGFLQATLHETLILEARRDPRESMQLTQSRANTIYHLGMLSHLVGDAAQPLHTTRHHHGWSGVNPRHYTRAHTFHAYVDGTLAGVHHVTAAQVRPRMKPIRSVNPDDPWDALLAFLRRSFQEVEPLYRMERDGTLEVAPGREFMIDRLADAASMLAALIRGASTSARPTPEQIRSWPAPPDTRPRGRKTAPGPGAVREEKIPAPE